MIEDHDGYDAADNASKCYALAIDTLREKLARFPQVKIGDCWLINADCREVLPLLAKPGAVVTDPPYGIGAGRMSFGKWRTSRMEKSDWDATAPDLTNLPGGVPTIIWGGNYFPLWPSRAFLVWDKGAGFKGRDFAECELAWCSWDGNARVLSYDPLAKGAYKDKRHPTEKPVAVMVWCLRQLKAGGTILDPYMGSGTTGVACVEEGRSFVGIEVNPAYFADACERIGAAYDVKQSELPVSFEPLTHEQVSLFGEGSK